MADVEEAQAARTLAAAQLVLDIATAASTEPKLDTVLRMALDRLGDIVEFSSGSVSLVDGDTLIVRASTGLPAAQYPRSAHRAGNEPALDGHPRASADAPR